MLVVKTDGSVPNKCILGDKLLTKTGIYRRTEIYIFTYKCILSHNTDRNQEQRPGRPFAMNAEPHSPPQDKTQPPPVRRGFPAKCVLDLKTLKETNPRDVVCRLNESMAFLKFYLRSEQDPHNSDEFIFDLTCTLANACSAPPDENMNKILSELKGSVFLSSKIPRLLDRVQVSTALINQDSQRRLIQCLIKLFRRYLRHLPSSYADIPYHKLKDALDQSSIDRKDDLQRELEAFKQARDNIIIAERHQKHGRRYINRTGQKPPNDFRDIPICPTSKEITSQERPFLRENILKGRYGDAEHYLDVQFRLLREDFLEPLREGIYETTHNIPRAQRNQLMKSYQGVRIIGKTFTPSGTIHTAVFDVSNFRSTSWTHSKKLIFGSLLCLSRDNFETMLFATVANRDPELLEKGTFDLRFIEEQNIFDIEKRRDQYQMVESPAYFEAHRHVLKGLKELDESNLPFKKYLVECCGDVDPPEYLRREDGYPVYYDLSEALHVPNGTRVPVLDPKAWPPVEVLPLNSSQLDALKTAVTTEFSVIQGPPGTGKTYVGTKIVRCLLDNRQQWDPENTSPMLMVCYTNHALDQFLEKVLEFLPPKRIIRVGGRCKSEQLQECNLKALKRQHRRTYNHYFIEEKMRDNEKEMKECNKVLTKADKVLLEFNDLEDGMISKHTDQLYDAVYPRNATSECQNTSNTFKLWLCNNTPLNDRNQCSNTPTIDEDLEGQDGSILPEDDVDVLLDAAELRFDVKTDINHVQSKVPCPDEQFMKYRPKENSAKELKNEDTDQSLTANSVFLDGSAERDCPNEVLEHTAFDASSVDKSKDKTGRAHEGNEETIKVEGEATRIQNERFIEGDEEYVSARVQKGYKGKSHDVEETQTEGSDGGTVEDSEGWTKVSYGRKPNRCVWLDNEGRTDRKAKSVKVENSQSKGTGAQKRKRKKRKKKEKIDLTADITNLQSQVQKVTMMPDDEAMRVKNIWFLSANDRLRLYLYWVECYRQSHRIEVQRREQKHEELCAELEWVRGEEEEGFIGQATVVGMTTSCAARYHSMLQRIAPKIVIIEEAAEVMETHIITSLSRNTKHTILIGDHKQLRPKATVYELAQKYNLEISLFERMVMNNMDCKRLSIQHRMRPEIAALTKRIYDHDITDHPTVCRFPDITGLRQNLFFVDHCEPEFLIGGLQSYTNPHEAAFLVDLCYYLLLQGYKPSQITILTMYTGQLLLLQKKMPKKTFEGVKVCAVDNFQGEENDIVLLSLVRSNLEGRVGFLGESNRICVALSRARQALYCIGNFSLLKRKCKLWQEICDDLETHNAIGATLQLVCKSHRNVTHVLTSHDFNRFGGCKMTCGHRLDCGHACDKPCHASDVYHDPKHEEGQCIKLCFKCCSNEHHCQDTCHYPRPCDDCCEIMWRTVPQCGHEQPVPCSVDPAKFSCTLKCQKVLKCGHNCRNRCGELCTTQCKVKCIKRLSCEHEKRMACFRDPMLETNCNNNCEKILACGHPCAKKCKEQCQCNTEIMVQLPCGHKRQVLCHRKDTPFQCFERCRRSLDCGHTCPGICHEDCGKIQCKEKVYKDLPCGHQQSVPCHRDPQNAFCHDSCQRMLECGHKCSLVCGRLCHEVPCKELCLAKCERGHACQKQCHFGFPCGDCMVAVNKTIPKCKHSIEVPCYIDPASLTCKKPCDRLNVCGHPCRGICGKKCESLPCKEVVDKRLPCDHVTTLPCHKNPGKYKCKERITVHLQCGHKQQLLCHIAKANEQNRLCNEKVEKELRCKHKLTLPCHKNPEECKCKKRVDVQLPCGHIKSLVCSTVTADLTNVHCMEKIHRKLPCEHEVTLLCYSSREEHCCQEEVQINLACGHKKLTTCSKMRDELKSETCDTKVTRTLPCGHEKEMNCSDTQEEAFCDLPCDRFLPCSHPCPQKCGNDCATFKCAARIEKDLACGFHRVSCLCSDDVSQFVCTNKCRKYLPCGHLCPGKCSEDCTVFTCRKMVFKRLDCAGKHSKKMPCSEDSSSVTCMEDCSKNLDCGHPCPGLCSQQCGSVRCTRKVEKTFSCGHSASLQCFQRKTAICMAPCRRRKSSCKHICKGICGQDCSNYPCDIPVVKTLLCGHKIQMPCSQSTGDVRCPASCGAKLPCGHQCSGICGVCQQSGSHELCQRPCGRLLVCSHRCKATCSEPCPPCDRKCGRCCPHGKCKKRCSGLCEPCTEPCTWSCPHYQCNNLCGEECDRPRCDDRCPKKLPCRHPCIGLCGENCPTVCAVCHSKQLSSMLVDGRRNKTDHTRYVQLFDCGHIIEVEEMDRWMLRELAGVDQLRRCPKCSTSITFSYRYGNIIKRSLKSLENVKKRVHEIVYEEATSASVLSKRGLCNDVTKLKFPPQVVSVVQSNSNTRNWLDWPRVPGRIALFIFTLKNHLLILQQVQRTHEVLERALIGLRGSSQQQVELKKLWNDTKDAIEKIKVYLEEPQLDLKTLSQVFEQTRKFFLFSQVLEAQSKAMMRQIPLPNNGATRLTLLCHCFRVFLKGNDDVLDLERLREMVNLLRTETSLPRLPLEEAKDFANFPGYHRDVWKSCDQGHVYFTGWIVRGGEDIPVGSEGCSRCTANQ